MDNFSGIHYILDCKLKNSDIFLNDFKLGINFFNKIIQELDLSLVMPIIRVNFPEYQNFKGIKPFDQQKIINKTNYMTVDCFTDFDSNKDILGGYSLFGIISESHISIHTFPEQKCFSFDLYSCKLFDHQKLKDLIKKEFDILESKDKVISRPIL